VLHSHIQPDKYYVTLSVDNIDSILLLQQCFGETDFPRVECNTTELRQKVYVKSMTGQPVETLISFSYFI
jgi:hypothetical protein